MGGHFKIMVKNRLNVVYHAGGIGNENHPAPAHRAITFIIIGQAVGAQIFSGDDNSLLINQNEFGMDICVAIKHIKIAFVEHEAAFSVCLLQQLANVCFLMADATYRLPFHQDGDGNPAIQRFNQCFSNADIFKGLHFNLN